MDLDQAPPSAPQSSCEVGAPLPSLPRAVPDQDPLDDHAEQYLAASLARWLAEVAVGSVPTDQSLDAAA